MSVKDPKHASRSTSRFPATTALKVLVPGRCIVLLGGLGQMEVHVPKGVQPGADSSLSISQQLQASRVVQEVCCIKHWSLVPFEPSFNQTQEGRAAKQQLETFAVGLLQSKSGRRMTLETRPPQSITRVVARRLM